MPILILLQSFERSKYLNINHLNYSIDHSSVSEYLLLLNSLKELNKEFIYLTIYFKRLYINKCIFILKRILSHS